MTKTLRTLLAFFLTTLVAGPALAGDVLVLVEDETVQIFQKTNPGIVIVMAETGGNILTSDNTIASALYAKWGIDMLCSYQRDDFKVEHPLMAGMFQDVEPKVLGELGFPPGSYFKEQSYSIDTVKDICYGILSRTTTEFSAAQIEAYNTAFEYDGGFKVGAHISSQDWLTLDTGCLDNNNQRTLSVKEIYIPESFDVACCNVRAGTAMPFFCQAEPGR